jgi:hypothetical protein
MSFVCIDYPGFVENISKAIETLGGHDRIEQEFKRRHGKLLLNYTPDNIFAKMITSNLIDITNYQTAATASLSNQNSERNMNLENNSSMPCFLMTVNKQNSKFNAKIVGKIKKIFTFRKIADFQVSNSNSNYDFQILKLKLISIYKVFTNEFPNHFG